MYKIHAVALGARPVVRHSPFGFLPRSYSSLEGYTVARVLIEVMRHTDARQVQPGSIRSALEAMSRLDLGGFTVHFGKNLHAGSEFSEISLLRKDGRYLV